MFDSNHVQNDFIYQTGGSTRLLGFGFKVPTPVIRRIAYDKRIKIVEIIFPLYTSYMVELFLYLNRLVFFLDKVSLMEN
jgi:hypothetical protein